jgi:hypothetical protein
VIERAKRARTASGQWGSKNGWSRRSRARARGRWSREHSAAPDAVPFIVRVQSYRSFRHRGLRPPAGARDAR